MPDTSYCALCDFKLALVHRDECQSLLHLGKEQRWGLHYYRIMGCD